MTTKPKTTAVSRAKERVKKIKVRLKNAETELNKAVKKSQIKKAAPKKSAAKKKSPATKKVLKNKTKKN